MEERIEGQPLGFFIKKRREEQGISMEQLSEGLCSVRTAWYLENGEREADRLLQEAMLERLGVGAEDYERYLDYQDYRHWKARQSILHYITYEKMVRAEELLERYRLEYCGQGYQAGESAPAGYHQTDRNGEFVIDVSYRLERQFYLSMLAQVRRYEGCPAEELRGFYEEALELTVPGAGTKSLAESALSLKELNLVLEAERVRRVQRPGRYREVLKYIEGKGLDRRGTAKIYPKAVYFLYKCLALGGEADKKDGPDIGRTGEEAEWSREALLGYCNKAFEVLRDNGRMYYLWEIIDMRGRLLEALYRDLREKSVRQDGDARTGTVERLSRENREWKQILERIYEEFRVPRETFEYCYLYVVKGVSCINDVIRIRRKMLGLSVKELCEGICDVKTLRRLESRKTSPQRAIVKELFERLGLPRELTRTELVTDSPKARRLMERLRESSNNHRWKEAERLLGEVKKLVSTEIRSNRQALMRKELRIRWGKKDIEKGEYLRQMRAALELTLPYEAFLRDGEKYLTNEEQLCIQNMMQAMSIQDDELLTCMSRFDEIYRPYINEELLGVVMGMYDVVMGYTRSLWGNMGEYDRADWHSRNIIEGCLRFRRLWMLDDSLYDRWWNYKERNKKGIPTDKVLDDAEELTKCIVLSRLAKSSDEAFYMKKLKEL